MNNKSEDNNELAMLQTCFWIIQKRHVINGDSTVVPITHLDTFEAFQKMGFDVSITSETYTKFPGTVSGKDWLTEQQQK